MAEVTKQDVVKFIENMSVLELSTLVKELEEKFGVSAAVAMAAPMAAAGAPGAAEAKAEEKTEFDVVMTSFGAEKIKVIKDIAAAAVGLTIVVWIVVLAVEGARFWPALVGAAGGVR